MSFAHNIGWVTRTLNDLKDQKTLAAEGIQKAKASRSEEIVHNSESIIDILKGLEEQIKLVDHQMAKLSECADNLEETSPNIQRFEEKSENVIQSVSEARDLGRTLQNLLQKAVEKQNPPKRSDARSAQEAPYQESDQAVLQPAHRFSLPQVTLPTFSGEAWEYSNFRVTFDELVNKTTLPKIVKFQHLMNCLKGEPKLLISKYQISEKNYDLAMEVLRKKYSDTEMIVAALTKRLKEEKAENNSIAEQRKLYERVYVTLEQISNLDEDVDTRLMKELILTKFSKSIRTEVYKAKLSSNKEWTIKQVFLDLDQAILMAEELNILLGEENSQEQKTKNGKNKPQNKPNSEKKSNKFCAYCKSKEHYSDECTVVPTINGRKALLRENKRCLRCTSTKHSTDSCDRKCYNCKEAHHRSVCEKANSGKSKEPDNSEKNKKSQKKSEGKPKNNVASQNVTTSEVTAEEEVAVQCEVVSDEGKRQGSFLPTIEANVYNETTQEWSPISIMLDTGADRTYITSNLAQECNFERISDVNLRIRTFGTTEAAEVETFSRSRFYLQTDDGPMEIEATHKTHLAGTVPKAPLLDCDKMWIEENNLELNSDSLAQSSTPDMIVGCDYLPDIWKGKLVRLPSGITLVNTIFGYTTIGHRKFSDSQTIQTVSHINVTYSDEEIRNMVTKDEIQKDRREFSGTLEDEKLEINKAIRESFRETIEKREEGYFVRVPVKEDIIRNLPDNYAIAMKRLGNVIKYSPPEVLKMVDDIFQDQLSKQIIEIVPDKDVAEGIIHYNPHQPVLTPQKTTTKCRVVFDGSAHYKNAPSLNDATHQGPVLLPDGVAMLQRFRSGETVIIADVEKAFLMVYLQEEDRDLTRMIWIKDRSKPISPDNLVIYRSTRVFFGLNASPYLLADTIIYHLESFEDQALAKEIISNLYVDNLILTTDQSTDENLQTYRVVKRLFQDMNMNLREFLSSDAKFNENVDEKDKAAESEVTKVLGLKWLTKTDQIQLICELEDREKITKRTVASQLASIYDPLGLLAPLLLPIKLLQRELWNKESNYDWDTPLSEDHQIKWKTLMDESHGFSIKLPRNVTSKSNENRLTVFTDASKEATATSVYISNELGTHLIFGKSKIRPSKDKWTIPKLEVHALKMGSDHAVQILEALQEGNIKVSEVIILSDSKIALSWVKQSPGKKEVGVLVHNRTDAIHRNVERIQEKNVPTFLGYVPTELNPADLGTRGLEKTAFEFSIWWNGPTFTNTPKEEWSKEHELFQIENSEAEIALINVARHTETETEGIFQEGKFTNSYSKFKRIVAYSIRAIRKFTANLSVETQDRISKNIPALANCKKGNEPISAKEYAAAERIILKEHQMNLNPRKSAWKNLNLKTDESGIVICGGRMGNSEESEISRFPKFIKPRTHLASLIIGNSHGKYHTSIEQTMNEVRRKFWIPQLRQQVKKATRSCVRCQRFNRAPFRYPDMNHLPKSRVIRSKPFENTGLDYFGPVDYRSQDGSLSHAYGAVFTCSTTRLTHIEIVINADTTAFLQAVRRFIAIRGIPSRICSDNAPIFVLADKILKDMQEKEAKEIAFHSEILDFMGSNSIEWSFITPYAPWQGGMYERLMRTIKSALHKALGRKILLLDELVTCAYEIAGILNSRPLTYVGDELSEGRSITPNDFVSSAMTVTLPLVHLQDIEDEYTPPDELLSNKNTVMQALSSSIGIVENVWKVWKTTYFAELRSRHKLRMDNKKGVNTTPFEGQIVLINDEKQPRNQWRLAKVTKVKTSSDGVIREVEMITETKRTIRRPINLVTPLELEQEEHQTKTSEEAENSEDPVETEPEKSTEEEEPIQPRYQLRKRNRLNYAESISSVTMIAMIIISLIMGAQAQPTMKCTNTGVQLFGTYDQFEICSRDYCSTRPRLQWNRDAANVWLPPAIKTNKHQVTAKVLLGENLSVIETMCDAVSVCSTIDCTFCLALLSNPECYPYLAIMVLGIILYIILLVGHCCSQALNAKISIGGPIKMGFKSLIWITNLISKTVAIVRPQRVRRNPSFKWEALVPLMTIVLLVQSTEGCQEVNMLTQASKVCSQKEDCQYHTTMFMNINPFRKQGCIRTLRDDKTTSEIKVEFQSLTMTCIRSPITTTQAVEIKVWSAKRCAATGSCDDNKCRNVTRDTLIPELFEANKYVGNTACAESCGGIGCGCFYPSSGCLFYRIYAQPLSEDRYDIFQCIEWSETVQLSAIFTDLTTRTSRKHELSVPLNLPKSIGGITITAETAHSPPSPILNTWFVKNKETIATWPQNLMPSYQCSSTNTSAVTCGLEPTCSCNAAQDTMVCTCEDTSPNSRFQSIQHRLPLAEGHWRIISKNGTVTAIIQDAVSTNLVLEIREKVETRVYRTDDKCKFSPEHVYGCYACDTGGHAEVTCVSQRLSTIANVVCDSDQMFTIPCTTEGIKSNLTFFEEYAKVQKTCWASCGNKNNVTFEITGVLKYTGSVWTSMFRLVKSNTTIFNEINFPDVGNLIDGYFTFMKSIAFAIGIAVTAFVMTGAVVASCLLIGMKRSTKLTLKILFCPFILIRWGYFLVKGRSRAGKQKHF